MNTSNPPNSSAAGAQRQVAVASQLLDPRARRAIRADPRGYAVANHLIAADAEVEVKVVANSRDTSYVPLPAPGAFGALDRATLESIQAAACTGTAGSTTTASTMSTSTSTLGCASSASSLGTAGTGD